MLLIFHLLTRSTDQAEAREICWSKVEHAIYRGYPKLLQRHQAAFSEAMDETELCFGDLVEVVEQEAKETLDRGGGVDWKLETFRMQISERQRQVDLQLMNSLQWFNKYLLFSAASRSVSNLQGLWADGPTSAWNGDYHFNINMQMTYWPIYGMGISKHLTPPFLNFTKRLFQSGKITARDLYGCPGSVVHAFTDNSLNTGILGDLEWSLCVTCTSLLLPLSCPTLSPYLLSLLTFCSLL
jgi:alpha-L-fucosidase 2